MIEGKGRGERSAKHLHTQLENLKLSHAACVIKIKTEAAECNCLVCVYVHAGEATIE